MSVCIIGGGLAGIALSINLKMSDLDEEVVLVTDARPSNTRVAGQRFRNRVAHQTGDRVEQLEKLFADRNGGVVTDAMKRFALLSVSELSRWLSLNPADHGIDLPPLDFDDEPTWFGPQLGRPNEWGNARGFALMQWLSELAKGLGVRTVQGTVTRLSRQADIIEHVTVQTKQPDGSIGRNLLRADTYVLAGGNPGGALFQSTNVEIRHSPHELAWEAGLSLTDLDLTMFHILGNCDRAGAARVGCFETDVLDQATIYLRSASGHFDVLDEETTHLLAQHQAHYQFAEISKRFIRHGGVVRIVFPDQTEKLGRVSHHYSHMGIETHDGFTVAGMRNLFAVGDAAGTGYWCGHKVRFPGVALVNCIVGAALVNDAVARRAAATRAIEWEAVTVDSRNSGPAESAMGGRNLKEINTSGLFDFAFGSDPEAGTLAWADALTTVWKRTDGVNPLLEISLACAFACHDVASGGWPQAAIGRSDLVERVHLHYDASFA
ncbi:hypothetical protein PCO31110_00015 [Pandoraea communis]|uniref:Uncharacterized protein n=1 Tax=Pandoraea communis TaxID=2508297 RepID=A0A5E4R7G6_9BURK|nr:FAD-binding protein [Pandoraea communis]VVD59280.1 hypothetical protein PCO31110_00015 [Pandoraea communis]